jgi:hypothetical protein
MVCAVCWDPDLPVLIKINSAGFHDVREYTPRPKEFLSDFKLSIGYLIRQLCYSGGLHRDVPTFPGREMQAVGLLVERGKRQRFASGLYRVPKSARAKSPGQPRFYFFWTPAQLHGFHLQSEGVVAKPPRTESPGYRVYPVDILRRLHFCETGAGALASRSAKFLSS